MNTNLVTLSVDAMSAERGRVAGDPPTARMKLRYGVNETLGWRPFALGADRERVWARLRDLDTTIIRIFAFSPWLRSSRFNSSSTVCGHSLSQCG